MSIRISLDTATIMMVLGMLPLLFLPQLPSLWMIAGGGISSLVLFRQQQSRWCQGLCYLVLGFIVAVGSAEVLMRQISMLGCVP